MAYRTNSSRELSVKLVRPNKELPRAMVRARAWERSLYRYPYYNARERLSELRQQILEDRIGICLDCVNTNGESASRGECRLKKHG